MSNKYVRQGNAVVNTDVDALDKYLEQRRLIKTRKQEQEENEIIINMLKTLMEDVAEIKKRLDKQ